MATLPKQKIPAREKTKEWGKKTMEYYLTQTDYFTSEKSEYRRLYDYASGKVHQADYHTVTDPFNVKKPELTRWAGKIRNFPIISSGVDLMMGEKARRPFNYEVVAVGEDTFDSDMEAHLGQVEEALKVRFINTLTAMGLPTNLPPLPEKLQEVLDNPPKDVYSIMGQDALDYIRYFNELDHNFQKAFYDYLVTGTTFSYRSEQDNDTIYETVSPLEMSYDKSPDVDFIEDGVMAARRKTLTVVDAIDNYHDILGKDASKLEEVSEFTGWEYVNEEPNLRQVEVVHVTWVAHKKVKYITYSDPVTGEPITFKADEDYPTDPLTETEEIDWEREIWEGYRFDGRLYKGIQRLACQRGKLPYNGISSFGRFGKGQSFVKKGIPFQILYNIFHFKWETTMAKNKDKLVLFPLGLMPDDEGWDADKVMYHSQATGFLFTKTDSDTAIALQQVKVLDLSLSQYAREMREILEGIVAEWEASVGITAPRKGQIAASEEVGNVKESIFRSAVISEELYRKFEKFQERDCQALIDVSQTAWVDGKRGYYMNGDLQRTFINIHPEDYTFAKFGVFAKNSSEEKEKLEAFRAQAHAFAQNTQSPYLVSEIIDASNFSKLKALVKREEEAMRQLQQQQQQAELEAQQQQQAAEAQEKALDRELEIYKTDKDYDKAIEVALIQAEGSVRLDKLNTNEEADVEALNDNVIKRQTEREKLDLQAKKQRDDREIAEKKIAVDAYKADQQLKVAKTNKNKYDK